MDDANHHQTLIELCAIYKQEAEDWALAHARVIKYMQQLIKKYEATIIK
jgi:hypothetical protein